MSNLFEKAGAVFDRDRTYRYRLWREWDHSKPTVAFCLLNPSTADEFLLDPTLTRCVKFAQRWGYGRLEVVNIFALRSTDPAALLVHPDPVGPDNDAAIIEVVTKATLVVAGWGAHPAARARGRAVGVLLTDRCVVWTLRPTADGQPGHPLYLPHTLVPVVWSPP